MEEHPIISFLTGGGLLMALGAYTIKTLLTKIDCLKRKGHKHDIQIAVLEEKLKNKL
tara:strand:+ start:4668 stop:4838 length:171 start_codon:yes stop_codon:yes gene_type:complete